MYNIRSIRKPDQPAQQQTTLHYLWVIDVSYSMVSELAQLRQDLKNKLATQLRPGQFVTIIYYSTNGSYGYVLDGFQLQGPEALTLANNTIDRWLTPIGLTGFVDPLKLAYESIMTFKQQQVDTIMVFMSDGYENQNPKDEVLNACKRIGVHALASFVVEYGDYANHSLLQEMAQILFGQLIYAGQLPDYNLVLDSVLGTTSMVKFTVVPDDYDRVAFVRMPGGYIRAWPIEHAAAPFEITINPTDEVFIGTNGNGDVASITELACMAIAFFQLGMVGHCADVLQQIGDVDIINKYFGAIGKQRRNQFVDFVRARIENSELFYLTPRDNSYMPHPSEPDFFDLIEVLSAEPGNLLLCRHHLFNYKRGSAVVDTKNETKLKFNEYAGQAIDFQSIVLNTSRANVSFRGRFGGTVDVSQYPGNPDPANLQIIPTHIYRTYNLVRDGICVMDNIPVYLTPSTIDALKMLDWYPEQVEPGVWLIDLSSLPIANQQRVSDSGDGVVLCDTLFGYKVLQAWQKVFRYYQQQMDTKQRSNEWIDKYGQTGSEWLESIGIHETNGFHPVNTYSIKGDVYYAPVIEVKVTGFNSLPSVTDVLKRVEAGKTLTGAALAMHEAIKAYQAIVLKPEAHLRINAITTGLVNLKREYEKQVSGLVFANLLSRQPFNGFVNDELTAPCQFVESFDVFNDRFTIHHPSEQFTFTLVETEEEVAI